MIGAMDEASRRPPGAHRHGRATSDKIHGLSGPLGREVADSFASFAAGADLYLSCGDSAATDLPAASVDAVITDPPFFDNVHYSQLADLFYVWQRHILDPASLAHSPSTRSPAEVQHEDAGVFTERLSGVWRECARVLRAGGPLVFTYHHARADGWRAVLTALMTSGFRIVAAHPIKAELSVAKPKSQAKEPIDLDIILVCRRSYEAVKSDYPPLARLDEALRAAAEQIGRLNGVGKRLSRNDVRVVVMAQFVMRLSERDTVTEALTNLDVAAGAVDAAIDRFHREQSAAPAANDRPAQLALALEGIDR